MREDKAASAQTKSRNEIIVDSHKLMGWTFPDEPTHQSLVVGPDEVLRITPSCEATSYFIGQRCLEYLDDGELYHGEWVGPMYYARDTEYMLEHEANELLEKEGLMKQHRRTPHPATQEQ